MKIFQPLLLLLCISISFGSFAQVSGVLESVEQEAKVPSEIETSTIKFEETEYDFGTIDQGETVSYVFKFTNTGDVPLTISNAKGSCGCTVPFFPKDPIWPGESSEIEVEFNSKNKKGKQSKRVTITANTDPAQTYLTVKGSVLVVEKDDENEFNLIDLQREKEAAEIEELSPNCFALYPNPTNEFLQLELKEFIGKSANIEIRNKMGQKIMDKKVNNISRETTRFDVSSYPPGIYMVAILMENKKPMTQCFVVSGN